MMGRQATGREQLFYTFSMEDHVPEHHLLRGIHHFLDLSAFRQHMEPFYSSVGRPSIDPELEIRMLIVDYPHNSGLRPFRLLKVAAKFISTSISSLRDVPAKQ
jgi:hypothetical protein